MGGKVKEKKGLRRKGKKGGNVLQKWMLYFLLPREVSLIFFLIIILFCLFVFLAASLCMPCPNKPFSVCIANHKHSIYLQGIVLII